jgi:hypothetical protein
MSAEGFGVWAVAAFPFIWAMLLWGLTFKRAVCAQCGILMPTFRKPANWRQFMWGGWTCPECGFELDRYGRPVEEQNALAKWSILRAAEEIGKGGQRPRHWDERIRSAHDQTQQGDAK